MQRREQTVKQKSKKQHPELTKAVLDSIVRRLEKGETKLIEQSKRLHFRDNSPLRKALREHLGGRPAYDAVIAKAMAARQPKAKKVASAKKAGKKSPKEATTSKQEAA